MTKRKESEVEHSTQPQNEPNARESRGEESCAGVNARDAWDNREGDKKSYEVVGYSTIGYQIRKSGDVVNLTDDEFRNMQSRGIQLVPARTDEDVPQQEGPV